MSKSDEWSVRSSVEVFIYRVYSSAQRFEWLLSGLIDVFLLPVQISWVFAVNVASELLGSNPVSGVLVSSLSFLDQDDGIFQYLQAAFSNEKSIDIRGIDLVGQIDLKSPVLAHKVT